MIDIQLEHTDRHIYFIGIGGISMSGLAEIMSNRGFTVSGSDMKASTITANLQKSNIHVYIPHSGAHITPDIDLIVYTAAISQNNPELEKARELNIPTVSRSEFLGSLMRTYKYPVCIAGTHGKTTTTSMLSETFISSGLNPTISVGGILKSIDGNIRVGGDEYFITEACEYCDSFLSFFPKIGIILNIEEDHMDYFSNLEQIRTSFLKFSKLIPWDGFLAINGHIEDANELIKEMTCKVETFGLENHYDWYPENIIYDDKACASFDVYYKGAFRGHLKLHVAGIHNVLNALSVCAVCAFMRIPVNQIDLALSLFTGANQRFEFKGKLHDITVIDDYAHHPTEIAATLSVAEVFPHKNLYIVFQPHTYTRTKAFLEDFAKVLSKVPNLILTDIYAAREEDPGDIHSTDIMNLIDSSTSNVTYIEDFGAIADYLLENCIPGDMIITMGAGNVNQIIDILFGNA